MGNNDGGRAQEEEPCYRWKAARKTVRVTNTRPVSATLTLLRLHTLSADELYAAHLHPYLQKASDELQSKVRKSQTDNADMLAKIKQQRAEIDQLLGSLQHAVADIEGSVNVMQANKQTDLESLGSEAWLMDQEVAATK
jgi:hypothetical protein